jgi:hypothetical protein
MPGTIPERYREERRILLFGISSLYSVYLTLSAFHGAHLWTAAYYVVNLILELTALTLPS